MLGYLVCAWPEIRFLKFLLANETLNEFDPEVKNCSGIQISKIKFDNALQSDSNLTILFDSKGNLRLLFRSNSED